MKYVAMLILVGLAGCQIGPGFNPGDRGFLGGDEIVSICDPGDPSCVPGAKEPGGLTVGLQNFREFYRSMVNQLELTPNEERLPIGAAGSATLLAYFTDTAKSILASKGVANEASNSMFFSSAILSANAAGIFVKKDLALADGSRKLLNGVNTAVQPNQLSSAAIDQIANNAFARFVGRMPSQVEYEAIRSSVQECAANIALPPPQTGNQSSLVANQNCMIVLIAGIISSIDSLKI